MMNELRQDIPEDLGKLDRALETLAHRAMAGFQPPASLLEKLKRMKPQARIMPIGEKEPASYPHRRVRKVRVWMMGLVAAAACLIAFFGFRNLASNNLGLMEYRSGFATIMRSGRAVGPLLVQKLRSGDILETHQGNLAALLDSRVQLLMNEKTVVNISARNKIALTTGEIWVYVTPGSGAFRVEVPGGVVDVIGTSFGVRVAHNGINVMVSKGIVGFSANNQDERIIAGERLFLPRGGVLSATNKIKDENLRHPPLWVEKIIKAIAAERLREFFPSAVPVR